MVEDWPRRARSPGPHRSSLLAASWKSIGLSHSYEMRGILPASAATPACASPAGQLEVKITDAGGFARGLPLSHGLHRGAMLELSVMSTKLPCLNCDSSPARSGMGETMRASSPPSWGLSLGQKMVPIPVNF